MTNYEWISVCLTVLGLIVSTVVLILLLKQLKLLAQQVKDAREAIDFSATEAEAENRRRRERATMDFIAATMTKLDETYDQVPASGSEEVAKFIEKATDRESSEFRSLRNYLNYLEDLSVGVNLGLFDLELVSRTIGPRMIRAWDSYKSWILKERTTLPFPTLLSDLQTCVETVSKVRAGRPAPALGNSA